MISPQKKNFWQGVRSQLQQLSSWNMMKKKNTMKLPQIKKRPMKRTFRYISLIAVLILAINTDSKAQVKYYFGALPTLKVSGKEFVDEQNRPVSLHGVMDTPSAYFNGGRWCDGAHWTVDYSDKWIAPCLQYFKHVTSAIANPAKGTYCNLFRLHLDPAWTNDPNKTATNGGDENDPSRFSADRLSKYLDELYIPIAEDALGHGMYVIIRPPGVFPHDVKVGDYYNDYLLTVWNIVSNHPFVKAHAGQIMLELGNEPVNMTNANGSKGGHLAAFFQPIVNKIRSNGFTGILLLPGTSYQAMYKDYTDGQYSVWEDGVGTVTYTGKSISDSQENYAYAVHNYPGWYGGWDANQTQAQFISTFEDQVPIDKKPIVITEVDWSPMKEGAGHWNELHTQYTEGNFGSWATGTTTNNPPRNIPYPNTQNTGWGTRFKALVDKHPNISWTLQGTTTYVDMDKYLKNGTIQPAFTDDMKAAGYPDASEACSKTCFEWYYQYACGDRLPMGNPDLKPEEPITPSYKTTADVIGNAKFDKTNAHYCFYTQYNSAFIFKEYAGTQLIKCAEFTVNLGEDSTIGYRLDVQLKDKDGNIIKDGTNDYIIGTEAKGTRNTNPTAASKTYDFQTIFAEYIEQYPGCTVGEIRLNTVVSSEDTNREGLYWFTIDKMDMNVSEITARAGSKGTSLEDIKMYKHESTKNVVVNDDAETAKMGGWGGTITRTAGAGKDGSYCYVLTNEKTNTWESQVNYEGTYPNGTEYTLSMDIKGASSGSLPVNIQKAAGNVVCWQGTINYTTEWQTVSVPVTINGEGADRLLFDYGGKSTLYIDNVQLYTGNETVTEITEKNIELGEKTNGAEVFGAGLRGTVSFTDYSDLSAYSKMIIKGTGGSLRVLYNRPATGDCPVLNPTLASGEAVVDLTAYPFFHLNSIKAGWEQTVNVSSITLISGSGNDIEIADYYISGAGHITDAAKAALNDEKATVIDATGLTNINPWSLSTENPNCLLIYKESNNVGSAYDSRNLVKMNAWGYDASRIDLVDGDDFNSPIAIETVNGASYTRNLTTTMATLALPFELDVNHDGGPAIYQLTGDSNDGLTFTKVTEDKLSAGSVILYYNSEMGETKLFGNNIAITAEGFNIQQTNVDGWYTAQNFRSQVIEDVKTDPILKDYEVYAISGDKFVHATKKLTLNAFRTFYLKKKSNNAAKASLAIYISEDNETTGVNEVTIKPAPTVKEIYDSEGRLIPTMKAGLNIMRMSDGTVRKVMK